MAENQGTQKQSDWKGNKEMNIQENSSTTDGVSGNENTGTASWRPSEDEGELKNATENPTGAAGQSPAEQTGDPGCTPDKAKGKDF